MSDSGVLLDAELPRRPLAEMKLLRAVVIWRRVVGVWWLLRELYKKSSG
jgi:hypothetical protein